MVVKSSRQLVPDYIQNLRIYQAGKPIEEVQREKGLTRISKLASNENPLGPSPYAIKAMTQSLWDIHRYPDMHAYALKTALAELYNLKKENIILGNGSEGIMGYIMRAFLQPGDQVLTSEKTFIGFYILARGAGVQLVTTAMTEDDRYDVKAMVKKINHDTKVIYIANPNNPTGTYMTRQEFDYLMEYVPEHCIVIIDEAYYEFASEMADDYPNSMDYRYDNVITLRTFSKAYGLSGIRVGYGFAHEFFIENLTKVKLPFEPNSLAQVGAVQALEDRPHLERTLSENKRLLKELTEYLQGRGLKTIPSVTNFVTVNMGSEEKSQKLFEDLLNHGVIIRPLSSNEMNQYVRISVGTQKEMEHFYSAMEQVRI